MSEATRNGGERVQKVLARAGVASRRACEQLMTAGRVRVNGEVVDELGARIDPDTAIVHVDGRRVFLTDDHLTVILNKPAGVVSAMDDPRGRNTLAPYAARYGKRLYHVGRLDQATEGLIVLTNDGELANRLMHPRYEVSKTYLAQVEGDFTPGDAKRLREGVELDDGLARADRVTIKDRHGGRTLVEIVLHSGKNRIVRRMCQAVSHPVARLVRTHIGPLSLHPLTPGETRRLTDDELTELMEMVGL
ncbi:rRNA pseudouridine synthase [Nanchangia anserum]|uniref:Pseudouridine synthase n=1 Tax=Nanchangia anserum TaxID=2692125 RepID=A0A8I0GBX5_9ACTO|nr:pseudouridine synthase [Nanchangia anserum]MBD3688728.1 rRNA pseudouridine synthase [Nanchangia anserum]QOX82472.1 rRNA pseudouridine synthase [Nanchangia anserum]